MQTTHTVTNHMACVASVGLLTTESHEHKVFSIGNTLYRYQDPVHKFLISHLQWRLSPHSRFNKLILSQTKLNVLICTLSTFLDSSVSEKMLKHFLLKLLKNYSCILISFYTCRSPFFSMSKLILVELFWSHHLSLQVINLCQHWNIFPSSWVILNLRIF